MHRGRDIRDYQLLATVRRRRGLALQEALGLARAEHAHWAKRQTECEADWHRCVALGENYAESVRCRTQAGQTVKLDELDAAKRHTVALQGEADDRRDACRQAAASLAVAEQKQADAGRQVAANEARVLSLVEQVAAWRKAAARQADDREEDERGDTGRVSRVV